MAHTPPPRPSPIEGEGAETAVRATQPPAAVRRARRLRKAMTLPETRLWAELRRTKLHVRRQAPIGRYIADFAIHGRRLVIEVDGPPHKIFPDQALRDMEREAWLRTQGYRVLRFTNAQVLETIDAVLLEIQAAAQLRPLPALPPSIGMGE